MRFGVGLATPAQAWRAVQRAESAGYDSAWLCDSQLVSADVFTALGAAAVTTERIRLATGVLVPSNRIAPAAANAFATLNALAPGRIDAGIGTGFSARLTMGMGPYPLARTGDYVRVMQAMWRGETVGVEVEGAERQVRFLNPDAGLINLDDPIPVHVSAFGPRSRRLTAELGADWINVDFSEDFAGAATAAAEMDEAYRAAGIDPATRRKTIFIWGSVLADGESAGSERVRAQVGSFASQVLHAMMQRPAHLDAAGEGPGDADEPIGRAAARYRALYETYLPPDQRHLQLHRGHLLFIRDDEQPYVDAELIAATTVTATGSELRRRLRRVVDAGYDEIVVGITPGQEDMIEEWMTVLEGL